MKILCRQKVVFWVILVVSLIKCEIACFATDKESIRMFDNQVLQIEDLCKAGKRREYYLKAADITKHIMANSTTSNLNNVAAKLLENILSKEVGAKDVRAEDVSVMKKLALFLITSGEEVSLEKRQVNVRLLSVLLGKIRKERLKDYKPKPVVANVPPPVGVPGMAGMSPDAIKDPVAKAKYEKAIKENRENNVSNARQAALTEIDKELCKPIIGYMIETFRAGDSSPDLLRRRMNEAGLSDSEKTEVLNGIGSRARY